MMGAVTIVFYSFVLLWLTTAVNSVNVINSDLPLFNTTIKTKNATYDFDEVKKPHNLYIGRCRTKDKLLHQENVVLNNDVKAMVAANIRIGVDGPIYITCVKILDNMPPGEGAYPSFSDGGVGKNYVSFDVTTVLGKGFKFHVEIFGEDQRKKQRR